VQEQVLEWFPLSVIIRPSNSDRRDLAQHKGILKLDGLGENLLNHFEVDALCRQEC